MVMLVLETFLLLLLAAALGHGFGRLLAETGVFDGLTVEGSAKPWLDDRRPHPALPVLPAAPTLLADAERARLAASLAATTAVSAVASATPAAVSPVVEAPSMPAVAVAEVAAEAAEITAAPAALVDAAAIDLAAAPAPAVDPVAAALATVSAADAPAIAAADAERAAEADAVGDRPLGLAAPLAATADDLKRIKGIGRQNEARLNALGIWHFAQIAAWTPENAKWAGSFLAFHGRIEREDWIGQAKLLAAGLPTEFSKRVDAGEVPTSSTN